jgi:hypothetical protein
MKTDICVIVDEPINELEDAAFKETFPWRCSVDGEHTSQDFKNLDDASKVTGVEPSVIEDAVVHYGGHVGDFVFVKQ